MLPVTENTATYRTRARPICSADDVDVPLSLRFVVYDKGCIVTLTPHHVTPNFVQFSFPGYDALYNMPRSLFDRMELLAPKKK